MKMLSIAIHGTAYDGVPSGARNRAVGLAAALLRSGHAVTWISPAGFTVAPLVAAELAVGPGGVNARGLETGRAAPGALPGLLPGDRWREIATDLDPRRPLARWLMSGRTLERVVPAGTDLFVTDYHPVIARAPTALTVHDLRYLAVPTPGDGARALWFRTAYPATARAAAMIVVPTKTVASECVRHLGVPMSRAAVVPNALGAAWRGASGVGATPLHLLMVGASDPRKDLECALAAMRRARSAARASTPAAPVATRTAATKPGRLLPLVVVSRASKTLDRTLRGGTDLARLGLLRFVDSPSDRAIVSLARDAAALIHPSRYEGFGMTVIEAMAVGLPVLAAKCDAVEEVSAGHAQILKVGDVAAWAAAFRDASSRGPRDDGLAEARIAHARSFSWDAAAASLVAAARSL